MSQLEKNLTTLVREARNKKAEGLRAIPGRPIQLRFGSKWTELPGATLSVAEVRFLLGSLLSDEEQYQLESQRVIQKWIDNLGCRIQLFLHDGNLSGNVEWRLENEYSASDLGLPPFLLEKWLRQSGLTLVFGPPGSGKSSLFSIIVRHFEGKKDYIAFSDDCEGSTDLVVPSSSLMHWRPSREMVLFLDSRDPAVVTRGLELAFQGVAVFMTTPARSIVGGLLQLSHWTKTHLQYSDSEFWPSFAECFVSALGLRLMPSLETRAQSAYELLVDTAEVKSCLSEGSVLRLVEIMSQGGDTSGMRTLNQAILQLLMKRKIDLRVGFDESPRPQELDLLLKKVGV